MNFSQYQKKSRRTAIYPNRGKNFIYPVLGLAGESGEVAEKFKKLIRDPKRRVDKHFRVEITKELGDVLWYIAQICAELKIKMDDVAALNIAKLASRKKRGVLHGDGDNR